MNILVLYDQLIIDQSINHFAQSMTAVLALLAYCITWVYKYRYLLCRQHDLLTSLYTVSRLLISRDGTQGNFARQVSR